MRFHSVDLERILAELRPDLIGARLQRVQHPRADLVILEFYHGRQTRLLISVNPRLGRLHATDRHFRNPASPSGFCQFLRARLEGLRLARMEQRAGDRIAELYFTGGGEDGGECFGLIVELIGSHANLILLDGAGAILQSLRHGHTEQRALVLGRAYEPPRPTAGVEVPPGRPDARESWNAWWDQDRKSVV